MAKTAKGGSQKKYDWYAIKMDYVTDADSSLRKIGEKYGVSHVTVAQHSRKENWFSAKKEYQETVLKKALSKISTKESNKLAKELKCVDKIIDKTMEALEDDKQFYKHVVTESAPAPEGIGVVSVTYTKEMEKLDSKQMRELMQVLKMGEEMKRSMLNIQKAEQLHKARIEQERLELEREKFEWEKKKAADQKPDDNNSIEIIGLEDGWGE